MSVHCALTISNRYITMVKNNPIGAVALHNFAGNLRDWKSYHAPYIRLGNRMSWEIIAGISGDSIG